VSTPVAERRGIYPGADQVVLRGAIVLGAVTTVLAAQAAGATPNAREQLALAGLAILLALRPESWTGVVLLIGLAYVWSTVPDPLTPLVLVAAAGMLVVHLAALVAAQGPATMRVDHTQVVRLLERGFLLWLAAAAVWALDQLADDLPDGRLVYATGLTLMLVITAVTTRLISSRR
jgi:hypothetical protein